MLERRHPERSQKTYAVVCEIGTNGMPHFLQQGSQHTIEEANESRFVTSVRWVIEATNGLLKIWKFLKNVLPNLRIPYLKDYLQIICSLCNAYRPPRVSNSDNLVIAHKSGTRMHDSYLVIEGPLPTLPHSESQTRTIISN